MIHNSLLLFLANLDLLIVGITVAANAVLGFSVYLSGIKSITNKFFFLLTIAIVLWAITNYAFYNIPNVDIAFFILKISLFFATWVALFVFTFFYVFPYSQISFPNWYTICILPLVIITAVSTLTPFVLKEVTTVVDSKIVEAENGPLMPLFGILSSLLVFTGVFILFRKIRKAKKEERKSLDLILVGVIVTFTLIIIFNLILPTLANDSRFVSLGSLFFFPFIFFTSYAILRHKLFNIKVAGTATLVFLLSTVTFLEVILVRDIGLIIYRSSIFLMVLGFGIILIRGVIKEIEQKERLTELNQKLQAAYDEVDRLSKAKSEFISIASHQLRTPLSAIKGYISMILEGTYGKINERAIRPIENVYKSNERLIKLVNDLLSISRIEAGRMEFNVVETQIEEVIEEVISMLKINVEKKGLYLKFEKPAVVLPKLLLDRDKIREVILNLIDNSIKYTKEGGVNVSLETAGDKLRVIIKDTGEGMTKDDLNKVFETFSRGSVGIKSHTEGAGLGLYIAKKFVEMHKGKIWAESEGKGRGSTFFVELPFSG